MTLVYAEDLASDLPQSWEIRPFEELVFFQEGPGIRNWQYVDEGVPFMNIRCLVEGRLDRASMNKVSSEEAFGKYRHFLLQADDYVVSSSGTLGRIATVQETDLPCMLNTSVIRMRPKNDELDRVYLKYFLLSNYYQRQIEAFATGSAQLNYGPIHLQQMFIVKPPLLEQRAIAHIIGTLDEMIELNRQMNETLEVMARAIFKSWFVDFDPVRAKAEGRDTGLPQHIADLFPDSFEDSELGEIPVGWAIKSLDQIANFLNGLALQKYPPTGERDLSVIKIAELRQGHSQGCDWANNVPAEYIVNDGDILFSWSGSLLVKIWCGGKGALNQHLFKVTSVTYPKWFYYEWVRHHLPEFQAIASGKATTMGHIQRYHLAAALTAVPNQAIFKAADKLLTPLVDKFVSNEVQSRTLTIIRDALLPKLISGELRVKDADEFILETRL